MPISLGLCKNETQALPEGCCLFLLSAGCTVLAHLPGRGPGALWGGQAWWLRADVFQGTEPGAPEEVAMARWLQSFSRYEKSVRPGPWGC